jgi:hypothetical protein
MESQVRLDSLHSTFSMCPGALNQAHPLWSMHTIAPPGQLTYVSRLEAWGEAEINQPDFCAPTVRPDKVYHAPVAVKLEQHGIVGHVLFYRCTSGMGYADHITTDILYTIQKIERNDK